MTSALVSDSENYDDRCAGYKSWTTEAVDCPAYVALGHLGGNLQFGHWEKNAMTGLDGRGLEFLLGRILAGTWAPESTPVIVAHRFETNVLASLRANRGGFLQQPERKPAPITTQDMVRWLHGESGLTWDQLSRILGVSRRSLHAWANGQRVSGANLERLSQVYAAMKQIPADTPSGRRNALFSPEDNQPNLFDRLVIHARKAELPRDEHAVLRRLGIAPED